MTRLIFALAVLLALSACAASPGGRRLDNDAVKQKNLAIDFYKQGRAYWAKGQYDLAIREYDEAIRLQPDFLLAYLRRGGAYRNKGLTDRAITDYSKAIEVAPDYARAYYHRGQAYTFKGTYDRAIADFKKTIQLLPKYGNVYADLAWVRAAAPDPVFRNGKRALELAERAVKLFRDANSLESLAAAYAELSRFEDAIRTQLQAITVLKNYASERSMAVSEKRLERYQAHKPWRME